MFVESQSKSRSSDHSSEILKFRISPESGSTDEEDKNQEEIPLSQWQSFKQEAASGRKYYEGPGVAAIEEESEVTESEY